MTQLDKKGEEIIHGHKPYHLSEEYIAGLKQRLAENMDVSPDAKLKTTERFNKPATKESFVSRMVDASLMKEKLYQDVDSLVKLMEQIQSIEDNNNHVSQYDESDNTPIRLKKETSERTQKETTEKELIQKSKFPKMLEIMITITGGVYDESATEQLRTEKRIKSEPLHLMQSMIRNYNLLKELGYSDEEIKIKLIDILFLHVIGVNGSRKPLTGKNYQMITDILSDNNTLQNKVNKFPRLSEKYFAGDIDDSLLQTYINYRDSLVTKKDREEIFPDMEFLDFSNLFAYLIDKDKQKKQDNIEN